MTGFCTLVVEGLCQLGRRVDQLRLERCSCLLLVRSLAPVRTRGIDRVDLRISWHRELTELVDRVDAWLHQVPVCVQWLIHAILLRVERTRSPLRLRTLEIEYVSASCRVLQGDLMGLTR